MPRCHPVKTEKYRKRPSPPFHAGDCKGLIKKGNDGKSYVSVADSRGIYKWVSPRKTLKKQKPETKPKPKGTLYEIHDNGGRPFIAEVNERQRKLTVYKAEPVDPDPDAVRWDVYPGKVIHETRYEKVFIGDNILRDSLYAAFGSKAFRGNSLLAHIKGDTYLHVGAEVFTFQMVDGDVIEEYHSPVGNSDVPYPFAIGKKYIYSMLVMDHVYVPREFFDVKKDIGGQYYGFTVDEDIAKKIEKSKKRYKIKVIHKRMW